MEIHATVIDEVAVVAVVGSVDSLNAEQLAGAFAIHLDAGRHRIVADFSRVDYTSSAGLRSLLGTMKDSRRLGGDLRLAGVQPSVERVLSLSGFTSIMKLYPGVDAAVTSFAAAR